MTAQRTLFDGPDYDPALDEDRLANMLGRVYQSLAGNAGWWTLHELQLQCGGSEAGISARIRDLRKPRFGSHIIERRRRGEPRSGLWEYRMVK